MDNIKSIIIGGVITILVGGTAYTFTQQDVARHFANDAGLTQQQAEEYIKNIPEDELVSFDEGGSIYVAENKKTLKLASEIDCENYEYEWESTTLTCSEGKAQLQKIASTELSLGEAYIKLSSDTASEVDMRAVIRLIDQMNSDYDLEISRVLFADMDEMMTTNLYNKSLLNAALESN